MYYNQLCRTSLISLSFLLVFQFFWLHFGLILIQWNNNKHEIIFFFCRTTVLLSKVIMIKTHVGHIWQSVAIIASNAAALLPSYWSLHQKVIFTCSLRLDRKFFINLRLQNPPSFVILSHYDQDFHYFAGFCGVGAFHV